MKDFITKLLAKSGKNYDLNAILNVTDDLEPGTVSNLKQYVAKGGEDARDIVCKAVLEAAGPHRNYEPLYKVTESLYQTAP
tara:strand:- start:278 stop:520 length:243 start_codon:yes stop_codon:yes gene_type:complete